jgi:hypothetical protein
MYLIYGATVAGNDPRRNNARQGENQLFRSLDRENTARYR